MSGFARPPEPNYSSKAQRFPYAVNPLASASQRFANTNVHSGPASALANNLSDANGNATTSPNDANAEHPHAPNLSQLDLESYVRLHQYLAQAARKREAEVMRSFVVVIGILSAIALVALVFMLRKICHTSRTVCYAQFSELFATLAVTGVFFLIATPVALGAFAGEEKVNHEQDEQQMYALLQTIRQHTQSTS